MTKGVLFPKNKVKLELSIGFKLCRQAGNSAHAIPFDRQHGTNTLATSFSILL